jgi:hypothetical protein
MRVRLGGEEDFACGATVAPPVMTPVGYKTTNDITTFFSFCQREYFPRLKYFSSDLYTIGYMIYNF